MIFYRVDIELLSEFVNNEKPESEKLNNWQKALQAADLDTNIVE